MTTYVQELYVFRVLQHSSEEKGMKFWRFIRDTVRSDYSPSLVAKIDEATHFEAHQTQAIVALYQKLIKGRDADEVEFVKVKITTETEPVPMDSPELLDERRRVALNKLTHDDVLALGVEGLAVYSKLKHHKPTIGNLDDDY